jgi:hypothetical protein
VSARSPKLKKLVAVSAIVIVGLLAWLVHMRIERSGRESATAYARREAARQDALAPYQRDLPTGTARADVDRYLASRNQTPITVRGKQSRDVPSYQVLLGEEKGDGFACDRWNIYVVMEFKPLGGSREIPLPSDSLQRIYIEQVGHCL